ncbi:MAG: response regulator [Deltaproteobacteria bacterium]|nr:response regulator [Deltaproteobacteria bacterium]
MSSKRALVVDDSKSVLIMLRRMLEQNRLAVDTAESAEEALRYLQNKKPDLILMDHILPGMNGLDATKAIADNPATASIPVIIHSSKDGEQFVKQAQSYGAACILAKPAKPDSLTRVLQSLKLIPDGAVAAIKPAAPPPDAAHTIPSAAIESLARTAAESVATYVARSLVSRLLDEQLPQLKQDLLTRGQVTARDVASELYAARFGEFSAQIRKQVQDSLTDVFEQLAELRARVEAPATLDPLVIEELEQRARQVATSTATEAAQSAAQQAVRAAASEAAVPAAQQAAEQLYTAQIDDLSTRVSQLQEQLAELQASAAASGQSNAIDREELEQLVQAAAAKTASEAATHAAQSVARQATQTATQAAGDITRRVVTPLIESTRDLLRQMYLLAGLAAAAGVVAAAAVYFLK